VVLEHEIPQGSKLYFGKSAKLKREIEGVCAEIFENFGFEEIATPLFSYNTPNAADEKEVIKISNEKNHQITLRSDSTFEVVRIATKRVERSMGHSKWFYIQPVFSYPTNEVNQIGAEHIGCSSLKESLEIACEIFKNLKVSPILQISDFAIPKKVGEISEVSLKELREGNFNKILQGESEWLKQLIGIQSLEDLENCIDKMPETVQIELKKLRDIVKNLDYPHIVIAPLYYSPMRYYEGEFFKFFDKNMTFALGGSYGCEGIKSSGFAIYTDNILDAMLESK